MKTYLLIIMCSIFMFACTTTTEAKQSNFEQFDSLISQYKSDHGKWPQSLKQIIANSKKSTKHPDVEINRLGTSVNVQFKESEDGSLQISIDEFYSADGTEQYKNYKNKRRN